jgi:5'-methylthioadenosine phosphorylase
MAQQVIGVIGGSGLYEMPGLTNVEEVRVDTPFGAPSDAFVVGEFEGKRLAFLPRHGRGHRFTPSEVPYCANVYGFKALGAEWILSVSAVGSLQENVAPGHMVVIDQFIDRTKGVRRSTFFGDGVVGHVQFADPVCPDLAAIFHEASVEAGAVTHRGGTYVCMEGPQFSTRAESHLYRSWGARVIGMTNIPEAKLAREAGLCYATLAMATDYDCWHEHHDVVSVEAVIAVLHRNVDMARRIIAGAARRIPRERKCGHAHAGASAVITAPDAMDPETRAKLSLLLDGPKK